MKIRIGLLLALVLLSLAVLVSADVEVNEENFLDKNFRDYIQKKYGTILTDEEIDGITSLSVDGLQISNLTGLEYFTELRTLYCYNNPVSSIDISRNTHLRCLSCRNTGIMTLDVSQCPSLVSLVKEYPRESLSTQSAGSYSEWNAHDYGLTILTTSVKTTVIAGDFISQPEVRLDSNYFPNYNFRMIVAAFDTDNDGVLSDAEIAEVTEIDCSDQNISSLDGIEFFYALETLHCENNSLSSLNMKHNPALKHLFCDKNQLTILNMSRNTVLEELSCGVNRIWNFDVSQNTALTYLDCSENRLTDLDVTRNTALKHLSCDDNELTSLDLSHNTALESLDCHSNLLTELDVSQCPVLCGYMNDYDRVTDFIGNDWFGDFFEFDSDVTVTGSYVSPPNPDPTEVPTETPTVEPTEEPTAAPVEEPTPVPTEEPTPAPVTQVTVSNGIYTLSGNAATLKKAKKNTLTKLVIPDVVEANGRSYKVTAIGPGACKGMQQLKSVSIGKNVKTIGKNAFASCTKLTTVKGGEGIVTIGDSAFSSCKVLKAFPVMNKLQTIGVSAFRSCAKLAKFTLAAKVKSIGKNAFNGCKGLKTIDVKTTKLTDKNVGAAAFKGIYKKATIKCPKKKLKAYKELFIKKGAPKTCIFE